MLRVGTTRLNFNRCMMQLYEMESRRPRDIGCRIFQLRKLIIAWMSKRWRSWKRVGLRCLARDVHLEKPHKRAHKVASESQRLKWPWLASNTPIRLWTSKSVSERSLRNSPLSTTWCQQADALVRVHLTFLPVRSWLTQVTTVHRGLVRSHSACWMQTRCLLWTRISKEWTLSMNNLPSVKLKMTAIWNLHSAQQPSNKAWIQSS